MDRERKGEGEGERKGGVETERFSLGGKGREEREGCRRTGEGRKGEGEGRR
jgi:hypothetical protein